MVCSSPRTQHCPYPRRVIIEATTKCNLRCITCPRNTDTNLQPGGSRYGEMSLEVFEGIKKALPGFHEVEISGCGECLLNAHFFYMLESIKEAGCHASCITNATLIDENAAERLVFHRIDEIIVSIDAAEIKLFEEIRRGASLEQVIQAISYINKYKRLYNSRYPALTIEMVPMIMNIHNLPQLIELAYKLGVTKIKLANLVLFPNIKDQSLYSRPELIKKYFTRAIRLASKFNVCLELPNAYIDAAKIKQLLSVNGILCNLRYHPIQSASEIIKNIFRKVYPASQPLTEKIPFCYEPWNFSYIAYSGNVLPCCTLSNVMGNVRENPFSDIWNSQAYVSLRESMNNNNPPPVCFQCKSQRIDYTI